MYLNNIIFLNKKNNYFKTKKINIFKIINANRNWPKRKRKRKKRLTYQLN